MSVGIGYRNKENYGRVDLPTMIVYGITHCAGCVLAIWTIIDEDLLFVDLLHWLQWFEDLILWSIITGVVDQQPNGKWFPMRNENENKELWNKTLNDSVFETFYVLGILSWFFSSAWYIMIRGQDLLDRNNSHLQQSMFDGISLGVLGLASSGQWTSLEKFLPRMKRISVDNKSFINGKTALHYAIEANEWKIVELLLFTYNSNIHIVDKNDISAVHLICSNTQLSDKAFFLKFLGLCEENMIIKGGTEYLDNIVSDSEITSNVMMGKSILHMICANKSTSLSLHDRIQWWMEMYPDFNVNMMDADGKTPLHYAIVDDNCKSIERLLAADANVNAEDKEKRTPLMCAVVIHDNNTIAIRTLLANDANINHVNIDGWTALHFAAHGNFRDNVDILLEHFPNTSVRNKDGKNAHDLAVEKGYTTVADTLQMNMPMDALSSPMSDMLITSTPKDISLEMEIVHRTHVGSNIVEEEEIKEDEIKEEVKEEITTKMLIDTVDEISGKQSLLMDDTHEVNVNVVEEIVDEIEEDVNVIYSQSEVAQKNIDETNNVNDETTNIITDDDERGGGRVP